MSIGMRGGARSLSKVACTPQDDTARRARIEAMVATHPLLTPEQRDRLAVLLRPVLDMAKAA